MRTGIERCALLLVLGCAASAGATEPPRLGKPAPAHVLASRDTLVFPDGRGLPPGSGTVAAGRALFARQCAVCHGDEGRGGGGGELAGGNPDLTAQQPDKTIGSYWPHATTLFDFIRRSMPLNAPWSLRDDEVYALVAYLLDLNGVAVGERLDAAALAAVEMPNRDGFRWIDVKPD
jgi:S-disulfanyl-L-cysteine oxidoreductase SoxD